jgi:hypothetical protein
MAFLGEERLSLTTVVLKDIENLLGNGDAVLRVLAHCEKLFKAGMEVCMYVSVYMCMHMCMYVCVCVCVESACTLQETV